MKDNFNLIAQSRYYLKRFKVLFGEFKMVNEPEQDYALREMALLIQKCLEMCIKGLVELLVGVDYKHTHLLSDNILIIRNNANNIDKYNSLEKILDMVDEKAARISEFHTKAVYVDSFATSIKELEIYMKIAEELHNWIDKNIVLG